MNFATVIPTFSEDKRKRLKQMLLVSGCREEAKDPLIYPTYAIYVEYKSVKRHVSPVLNILETIDSPEFAFKMAVLLILHQTTSIKDIEVDC